jgi:hypothetical protein
LPLKLARVFKCTEGLREFSWASWQDRYIEDKGTDPSRWWFGDKNLGSRNLLFL